MPLQSRSVVCYENRLLADWFFRKYQELDVADVRKPSLEETFKRAFVKVCDHATHIKNLHDAKQVKGIGPWLLKKMKDEFFDESATNIDVQRAASTFEKERLNNDLSLQSRKKGRVKKRYLPGKNTAAYALLITLLRAHQAGKKFMRKQELIDAAEQSGLSAKPIMPVKSSIWSGPRSASSFFCGWSAMKTLGEKGLVNRFSNPSKYKLTDEGKITAQECIEKSALVDHSGQDQCSESEEDTRAALTERECREGFVSEGKDFADFGADIEGIPRPSQRQNQGTKPFFEGISAQEIPIRYDPRSYNRQDEALGLTPFRKTVNWSQVDPATMSMDFSDRHVIDRSAQQCSRQPPMNASQNKASLSVPVTDLNEDLALPPLRVGEKLGDIYDVICILDRREQFRRGSSGSQLQKFADGLEKQFQMKVETRQVPVGDAIWIARHKQTSEEYVLDFVIERKSVDDLWQSIRDKRYKNQKLRMLESGLKRLIYLVEGDVNMIDSTESCKTAIFSTEIVDGFHVLRTADTSDTLKQYGNLTLAIKNRYSGEVGKRANQLNSCKTYTEFVEHCKNLDRDRVTDIFCLQLMQINHVTEDVALSIQEKYPTVYSLVQAYMELEGDVGAQEKLLLGVPIRGSSRTITAVLSKNVYKLIWSG